MKALSVTKELDLMRRAFAQAGPFGPGTLCPLCARPGAVVPLTPGQRAAQPDDTTHVCHPAWGGCNNGFARIDAGKVQS